MNDLPTSEYRMELGGAVLSLRCNPPEFASHLVNWFGLPSSGAHPHVTLDLKILDHEDCPHLPDSLVTTKTVEPDGSFDIADGLFRGRYDQNTGHGTVEMKAILTRGRLMRIFEQFLYQAFQSARSRAGLDALLIHSSAVIHQGRGFLFVGPSEAGKSTVALHSSRFHVLGDEMNLVHFDGGNAHLVGTAFNGTFRAKRPGKAPLKAVFLLQQAPEHGILPIPVAEAVTLLTAEIVPDIGLDQAPGKSTVPAMVDMAVKLSENSVLKQLRFLPDPGFWDVIAEEFPATCPREVKFFDRDRPED